MSKPKMLYICNHDILEYNHLKMFNLIGFDVVSTCKYLEPDLVSEYPLPPLKINYNNDLVEHFKRLNPGGYSYGRTLNLDREFVDKFDVILTSWIVEPLLQYENLFKNKLVCYETLGQSNGSRENLLTRLKSSGTRVIRIADTEQYFPNFAGADAIIDLEVDTDYFRGWTGEQEYAMTVNTAFSKRVSDCKYREYRSVIKGLPVKLFGRENDNIREEFCKGEVSRDKLLKEYRINRVGFASVSIPCPCTLTPKEMMSVGMPVVTYGPKIGGPTFKTYKYIETGSAGYWSDDLDELRDYIRFLLDNFEEAKKLSVNARNTAVSLFSYQSLSKKWKDFFSKEGISL